MRRATVGAVVGLAVASAILLGGCVAAAPAPAGITASQRSAATRAELALLWAEVSPGDPSFLQPRVKIVKYTNYLDAGPLLIACMHKAGYRQVVWNLNDGLVDTDIKPVDRFQVEVAIYVCEAEYPADPLELGYLSDAQEEYLYTYWSNETVPCLRTQGAVVANLPPVGEFGEGYEDVGSMNPYAHAKLPHGINEQLLVTRCPPYPGQLYSPSR